MAGPPPPPPPPPPEPEPEPGQHAFFRGFDAKDGGLRRAVPPHFFGAHGAARFTVDVSAGGAGRSVVAARDVVAGETLLVAERWASTVMPRQRKKACAACMSVLPAATGRVGKNGPKGRGNRKASAHSAEDASAVRTCDCGLELYCNEQCVASPRAAWHRRCACAGAQSIQLNAGASDHTKTVARLVLDTILRGAFPTESAGGAGASWDDGVLLLQSHVASQCDGQTEDDNEVMLLVHTALKAQAGAVVTADDGFDQDVFAGVMLLAQTPSEMITALISAVQCNNFGVYDGEQGASGVNLLALAVFPAAALFNHSCRPKYAHPAQPPRLP